MKLAAHHAVVCVNLRHLRINTPHFGSSSQAQAWAQCHLTSGVTGTTADVQRSCVAMSHQTGDMPGSPAGWRAKKNRAERGGAARWW